MLNLVQLNRDLIDDGETRLLRLVLVDQQLRDCWIVGVVWPQNFIV